MFNVLLYSNQQVPLQHITIMSSLMLVLLFFVGARISQTHSCCLHEVLGPLSQCKVLWAAVISISAVLWLKSATALWFSVSLALCGPGSKAEIPVLSLPALILKR